MNHMILSICVPTYNNAETLEETLQSVVYQIRQSKFNPNIELIIVNNGSNDKTAKILNLWKYSNPDISINIHSRDTNIGSDNIYLCTQFANGEYILLLSADDVLHNGAIESIFKILEKHPDIDAINFNVVPFHPKERNVKRYPIYVEHEHSRLANGIELLERIGKNLAYMSNLIYKKELTETNNYSFAMGSGLLQTYAHIDIINSGKIFYLSEFVAFGYREDSTSGWNYFEIMVSNFNILLVYAKNQGIDGISVDRLRIKNVRNIIGMILHFKSKGQFGKIEPQYKDGLSRIFTTYRQWPLIYIPMIILIIMPSPMVKLLRNTWESVKLTRKSLLQSRL